MWLHRFAACNLLACPSCQFIQPYVQRSGQDDESVGCGFMGVM